MRASIITMTSTYNYGATLQAYALQTYVETLGCSCDIIDHMGWAGHRTIDIRNLSTDTLTKIPYKRVLEMGYRNFEKFYEEYMHMTKRYTTISELYVTPPKSDLFITGSDQVWNPRDLRKEFYLDFAPPEAKKISYAASIGVSEIADEVKGEVSALLEKMDAISVREQNGKVQLTPLTPNPIHVNCDPAFLLDEAQWFSISSEVPEIKGDYLLCYLIYKPDWFNEWAKAMKAATGLKIVFVGLQGYRKVYCDYYVRCAGPREFLWLVEHAKAVATSSFHGTVFSIIFGKPFAAMPDPPRPDRIHNLLKMFDLQDRELYENKVVDITKIYSRSAVKMVIKAEQEKTRKYFQSVMDQM